MAHPQAAGATERWGFQAQGPRVGGCCWRGGPGLSCSMGAWGWSPGILVNDGWPACSGRSHSQGVILQSWLVMDTLVRKCRAAICKEGRQKQSWDPCGAQLGSQAQGPSRGASLYVATMEQLASVGPGQTTHGNPSLSPSGWGQSHCWKVNLGLVFLPTKYLTVAARADQGAAGTLCNY